MSASTPFELSFENDHTLAIRVSMIGPQHDFQSGKRGYTFSDHFDWDGRSWRLQFRAIAEAGATLTTLGTVKEHAQAGQRPPGDEPFGLIRAN